TLSRDWLAEVRKVLEVRQALEVIQAEARLQSLRLEGSGSRPLPESVEKARSEVVRCLREHDRRPLNCWQEVEAFKEEVRKLEKGWVDK
nr:Chain A, MICOS complex subunit MIC60,MICOS complex subunit MIC60-MIC19,Mic60-Mic19 [Thermochaetoides thermophila DSM 1495]7PV0_B Chain B, MICOS complex subunit MIC60,MICOS complex subunit MIC60-MIC19,Mic60-Mic19 [Thermochaetoides thermophila DSM 1495]7PV0_C Chain C, MICOS complex subunit MIC60,MICOS complex subunit MIC60-MIC19,Mic60-Mic19 [Thermochaetoides thermophila DSM 1495]7PV0_D Chain D, MICOS complex subunit MIC60,MICOS complex subunit MIC60-MIC19,Mic60-Mic19 [Thermochaetoides thermophi